MIKQLNSNEFLIRSAIKFEQLDPDNKKLVYDFDHQFIPAEKHDVENWQPSTINFQVSEVASFELKMQNDV